MREGPVLILWRHPIMTKDELRNLFAFPAATPEQLTLMDEVRKQTLKVAGTMLVDAPESPE